LPWPGQDRRTPAGAHREFIAEDQRADLSFNRAAPAVTGQSKGAFKMTDTSSVAIGTPIDKIRNVVLAVNVLYALSFVVGITQGHAVLAWRPEPIRRRVSGASVR
jgi:hypothetical protein